MVRLPPCGGSGLKYGVSVDYLLGRVSPSMRREWIEICVSERSANVLAVSLHAEGVD